MEVYNMLCIVDIWECVIFVHFCRNFGNETREGHKNDMWLTQEPRGIACDWQHATEFIPEIGVQSFLFVG